MAIAAICVYILSMHALDGSEEPKIMRTNRLLVGIAGSIYFVWWFAVELLLPDSFNPFLSRLLVVAMIFLVLALSYISDRVGRDLRFYFVACTWLITLHYFYLFYENAGDTNWIVGAFVTVMAINFGMMSGSALFSYAMFVTLLSSLIVYLLPPLRQSVFLPGLITIFIQAYIGLRSRLSLIKTLAASNARFQLLFDSTFEGNLVHEGGWVTSANQALTTMMGYSQAEMIGKNALDLIFPTDREIVREKIAEEMESSYETRGMKKNGEPVDIEVRAKNFPHGKTSARLVSIRDISDRKRAESERIKALTMADNVRLRDEFISIASHELKTPISTLKIQTQLIERNLSRNPSQAVTPALLSETTALLSRQVDRLIELIDSMLDVSCITAGRFVMNKKEIDIVELAREVISMLTSQGFTIDFDSPEHLIICADRSRIKQVLENLLTNALKYGDGKSIRITVKSEKTQAVMTIEDHGLGIAPEAIKRPRWFH